MINYLQINDLKIWKIYKKFLIAKNPLKKVLFLCKSFNFQNAAGLYLIICTLKVVQIISFQGTKNVNLSNPSSKHVRSSKPCLIKIEWDISDFFSKISYNQFFQILKRFRFKEYCCELNEKVFKMKIKFFCLY